MLIKLFVLYRDFVNFFPFYKTDMKMTVNQKGHKAMTVNILSKELYRHLDITDGKLFLYDRITISYIFYT